MTDDSRVMPEANPPTKTRRELGFRPAALKDDRIARHLKGSLGLQFTQEFALQLDEGSRFADRSAGRKEIARGFRPGKNLKRPFLQTVQAVEKPIAMDCLSALPSFHDRFAKVMAMASNRGL